MLLTRMLRGWRPAACAIAVFVVSPLALSCGGEDEQQAPTARQTLNAALAAFERGDPKAFCDVLSRKARLVIGLTAHGAPPFQCRLHTAPFRGAMQAYGNGFKPVLEKLIRPTPDTAVATYRLPAGMRATIPLSREDGVWKLDGLFDVDVSLIQVKTAPPDQRLPVRRKDLYASLEPPRPLVAGRDVVVRSARGGRRCSKVTLDRFPELTGGCVTRLAGRGVRFTLQTPFGFMWVARCRVTYELRVDGTGRAWVADFTIEGRSPCLDMARCTGPQQEAVPRWARLAPGRAGELRLAVHDMCIDSCYGRFAGRWDLGLSAGRNGLRARSDSMFGTSGLRVDGAFRARGAPLAVDARAASRAGDVGVESPRLPEEGR